MIHIVRFWSIQFPFHGSKLFWPHISYIFQVCFKLLLANEHWWGFITRNTYIYLFINLSRIYFLTASLYLTKGTTTLSTTTPLPPPPDVVKRCPLGGAVKNGTGERIECSPFRPATSPPQCPNGTICIGGPADEPGTCCLSMFKFMFWKHYMIVNKLVDKCFQVNYPSGI